MKLITPLAAVIATMLAGIALAAPLKVRTEGTKSQSVLMCSDCNTKAACTQVGDYLVGLTVDLENSKLGTGRFIAHIQDRDKRPVTDVKVALALSMPDHQHASKPITLRHDGHGRYAAATNRLGMKGRYRVEVSVILASGDTVQQVFSFIR